MYRVVFSACNGFSGRFGQRFLSVAPVRVRFAPSPTGHLHLGGLRTALFNFLLARKSTDGKFILRIEDTDQARSVPGSIESMIAMMNWCNIDFDEGPLKEGPFGPYIQSERLDLYKQYVDQLIQNSNAYRCFCTSERLESLRHTAHKTGARVTYDRKCLSLSKEEIAARLADNVPHTVRLLVPHGTTTIDDRMRGKVSFNNADVGDQILLKSDGYPTYHLANVVDDHLMRISHVIRGDEWLSSTPKHVLLYNAFNWTIPEFIHLPLLLNQDGTKFSKRHNHASVKHYQESGVDPLALINSVARLGWTPKVDDIQTLDELIKDFSLDSLNLAGAVLQPQKLVWLNKQMLKRFDLTHPLLASVLPLLQQQYHFDSAQYDQSYVNRVFMLLRGRCSSIRNFVDCAAPFFRSIDWSCATTVAFRADAWKEPESRSFIDHFVKELQHVDWNDAAIQNCVEQSMESSGTKKNVAQKTLRLCVTGTPVGAGLASTIELLGRKTVLNRLTQALKQ